jgi:hypothetical protein
MPTPRSLPEPGVLRALEALAAKQAGLFRWSQALDVGYTAAQVRTMVRVGQWRRVRHGVLAPAELVATAAPHFLECAARWFDVTEDVVFSHESAAVLHGFGLVEAPAEPVFTVARDRRGAVRRAGVGALPDAHRCLLLGLPVTTPERTLADVLRSSASELHAQEVADAAARLGLETDGVARVLEHQRGWPGIRQACRAWGSASVLSESPLESRCRVWFRHGGLSEPEQQVRVVTRDGQLVRLDFFFRQWRTVVEADGRVKYEDAGALWAEKRREDALRDLGLEVVRATWADHQDGGAALVQRIRRAMARAAARPPAYPS